MSKASEYAEKRKKLNCPTFLCESSDTEADFLRRAMITDDGRLMIASSLFSPRDALKFAAWINDVFGEEGEK